jgi:hypothetical protein
VFGALRVGVELAELPGQPLNFSFGDDWKLGAEIRNLGAPHVRVRHVWFSRVAKEIVRADFRLASAPQTEAVFAVPEFLETID